MFFLKVLYPKRRKSQRWLRAREAGGIVLGHHPGFFPEILALGMDGVGGPRVPSQGAGGRMFLIGIQEKDEQKLE